MTAVINAHLADLNQGMPDGTEADDEAGENLGALPQARVGEGEAENAEERDAEAEEEDDNDMGEQMLPANADVSKVQLMKDTFARGWEARSAALQRLFLDD